MSAAPAVAARPASAGAGRLALALLGGDRLGGQVAARSAREHSFEERAP